MEISANLVIDNFGRLASQSFHRHFRRLKKAANKQKARQNSSLFTRTYDFTVTPLKVVQASTQSPLIPSSMEQIAVLSSGMRAGCRKSHLLFDIKNEANFKTQLSCFH
jgi:hypothetical protein